MELYAILHASATHGTWLLYQIWIKSTRQQQHKLYEKVAIITDIWHRAKCYFTSMIHDDCFKYEQNHDILLWEITKNTKNVYKKCINCSNLKQSTMLCYVHQKPMVPDHGTKYGESSFIHHGGMREDKQVDG